MKIPKMLSLALSLALGLSACEPIPGTGGGTSSSSSSSSGGASTSSGSSSSGRQGIDAQKLCTRLINECGQALTMQQCVKSFGILRVTPACIDGINRASCAELGAAQSTVLSTCFPPCTGTLATCNTDGTLTFCSLAGTTQVADCQASCIADGFSAWTGVCGTTYQGEVAERAQCWCK